jgi:branched-chain amino acid transport system permease protein
VASGFTLIFGLMRNVNLAHGSLYLLGGYLGFEVSERTGSWLLAFPVVFVVVALLGCRPAKPGVPPDGGRGTAPDHGHHRPVGGDRRHDAVDLGRAELHDLCARLAERADDAADHLVGPRSSGEVVYLRYPAVRMAILFAAIVIGVACGWC